MATPPNEAPQCNLESFSHRGEMPNPVGPLQQGHDSRDFFQYPDRVHVGGLYPDVTALELERLFTAKGFSVRRINVINTKKRTNYAFVTFNDANEPHAAMFLAQNEGIYLRNRLLTVNPAYRQVMAKRGPKPESFPEVYASQYLTDCRFTPTNLLMPDTHLVLTERGFVNALFLMQPLRIDSWGTPIYPMHTVSSELSIPAPPTYYTRGTDCPEHTFDGADPAVSVPYNSKS
ncbi:hypothetical protein BIW11_07383 [Tropilaelaps mercedesae]|uniref:RRM domain-containing protein n=1 Tax=Tropilaelaps mercedesae TaxID=418985 RepID=A0A1V9XU69_9ACAR|nr:hypothetical protein BIW11_07383 [Tropilaelaps mercedesae]